MLALRAPASSSSPSPAKPLPDAPLVDSAQLITPSDWLVGIGHFQPGASSSCFVSFSLPTPLLDSDDSKFCPRCPARDGAHDSTRYSITPVSDTAAFDTSPSVIALARNTVLSCSLPIPSQQQPPRQPSALRQRQLRASSASVDSSRHLAHVHVRSRKSSPYSPSAVVPAAVPTACFPRILHPPERHPPRPPRPP